MPIQQHVRGFQPHRNLAQIKHPPPTLYYLFFHACVKTFMATPTAVLFAGGDRRRGTDDREQTTADRRLPTATATRDFSPVTRHLSLFTRHAFLVTHHPSPVASHPSPVTLLINSPPPPASFSLLAAFTHVSQKHGFAHNLCALL